MNTVSKMNIASLALRADCPGPKINRNIYGHFAEHLGRCIEEGIWVGTDSPIKNTRGIRDDVVAALRKLNIPVLRWPGGCFADEYHWRDGIGPREKRPTMINTHWGAVVENNAFGTHEFMDLVEQLGCEAYICGNVGSGTPEEMMDWVEYLTSDAASSVANERRANGRAAAWPLRYFGVGNESWGCGGNMRAEYYADQYRRYNTFVKNYQHERPLYRIACGANAADYRWTEVLMREAASQMDGLSLHYYTITGDDWQDKGSATDFDEGGWIKGLASTLRMRELLARHCAIMDRYDPQRKVGLIVDEWGCWHNVEPGTNPGFLYQQNTLRDAVVAGLNFHLFHERAERVTMANIAQTVNVLQAVALTDGPRLILTPTYHVFEMFKVHHDATALRVDLISPDYAHEGLVIPAVSASASRNPVGRVHLSLVNTHASEAIELSCALTGHCAAKVSGRILTAEALNAHNSFDAPETVAPQSFDGARLSEDGGTLAVTLPAKSVVILEL